jgi:hypothetical protein
MIIVMKRKHLLLGVTYIFWGGGAEIFTYIYSLINKIQQAHNGSTIFNNKYKHTSLVANYDLVVTIVNLSSMWASCGILNEEY